ncbi:MAG: 50S ribosomal protein L6 [Melioribacteraceae bacterium]|nr:50S ribosomal protein L6 [Melioribacteraceae bacterium]MCF8354679.1 50S ribosomal protein L6 [Melioribacteraceae bacterium]MCF8393581.1 50S ribosomal protein L6 [Melioribacteraceae bacterium]MCF8419391.1 50S ribosomal protein L6 [Melioribacteraceae bacterium]
MSRVGKQPINIKDVEFTHKGNVVKVKGKLGEIEKSVSDIMKLDVEGDELHVKRPNETKTVKSLHGLTRALINNMVEGVTKGYSKSLEIVGVGYRAEAKGNNLFLNIGYSHPIYFVPPEGITIEVPVQTQIKITGIDKELVGLVAAKIRSFRKPEPYKGKGIKYSNELIIKKAGKTAG